MPSLTTSTESVNCCTPTSEFKILITVLQMSKKVSTKPPSSLNPVHKDIMHSENIRKEMKYFDKNRMDHFQLNPNNSNKSMIIDSDYPSR
jgi:hypothetical protein